MTTTPNALPANALIILDATGDTRITWGTDAAERDMARETFDTYRRKGFLAYSLTGGAGGGAGVIVKDFDPAAGPIILAPPMVGG